MEQIKSFFKKAQADETLKETLKKLAECKANIGEVVALAKSNGFDFTKEDLLSLAKENLSAAKLSEEQLAAVSGGAILPRPDNWLFSSPMYSNCVGTIDIDDQNFSCRWDDGEYITTYKKVTF